MKIREETGSVEKCEDLVGSILLSFSPSPPSSPSSPTNLLLLLLINGKYTHNASFFLLSYTQTTDDVVWLVFCFVFVFVRGITSTN